MRDTAKPYIRAARIKAPIQERNQEWEVYQYKKVQKRGDWRAEPQPRKDDDLTAREYGFRQRVLGKRKRIRQEHGRAGKIAFSFEYKQARTYSPLLETPSLFLDFSRLADGGHVSVDRWFEWVETYGVLDSNDSVDIYSRFAQEALLASRIRRLFEAAIREPKPDVKALARLVPMLTHPSVTEEQVAGKEVDDAENEALRIVGDAIETKIYEECVPELLVQYRYRGKRRSPLRQSWQFRSLLGAMWLQFLWRVETHVIQHCVVCGGRIPKDKYRSSIVCSRSCKQKGWRERNSTA